MIASTINIAAVGEALQLVVGGRGAFTPWLWHVTVLLRVFYDLVVFQLQRASDYWMLTVALMGVTLSERQAGGSFRFAPHAGRPEFMVARQAGRRRGFMRGTTGKAQVADASGVTKTRILSIGVLVVWLQHEFAKKRGHGHMSV